MTQEELNSAYEHGIEIGDLETQRLVIPVLNNLYHQLRAGQRQFESLARVTPKDKPLQVEQDYGVAKAFGDRAEKVLRFLHQMES